MKKQDIRNFTLQELEQEIIKINEAPYRAKQIFSWLYKESVLKFCDMSNIAKTLTDKLEQRYYIGSLNVAEHLKSPEGIEKVLFRLQDGNFIETVMISSRDRTTLCLSTQVGCKFACIFCASGQKGFTRNLTVSEIMSQILYFRSSLKCKITNYVFMGMGEPLDNYGNVVRAIWIMNDPQALNIGARRITVSTCGIIPGINKLGNLDLQINLSISLHAANDRLRDKLMPVNKIYPLNKLIKACEDFIDKKGRMITLEYILIRGKNDSLKDADELVAITKRLKAKVNLITYSTIPNLTYQPTQRQDIRLFIERLTKQKVKVTLRESKGKDIQAACGQLAGKK